MIGIEVEPTKEEERRADRIRGLQGELKQLEKEQPPVISVIPRRNFVRGGIILVVGGIALTLYGYFTNNRWLMINAPVLPAFFLFLLIMRYFGMKKRRAVAKKSREEK